jgi:hypothetical protein
LFAQVLTSVGLTVYLIDFILEQTFAWPVFEISPCLVVENASQKHLLESLPLLLLRSVRAWLRGRRRVGYLRVTMEFQDLGSFEQFRNPGNFPVWLQGNAFPIHDSPDAMSGRVNEDFVGGYVIVEEGESLGVAGIWREKDGENGE